MYTCAFCGHQFKYGIERKKCIVCNLNSCSNCNPSPLSTVCMEHFKMISESKRKEFEDFCLNQSKRLELLPYKLGFSFGIPYIIVSLIMTIFFNGSFFFDSIFIFLVISVLYQLFLYIDL